MNPSSRRRRSPLVWALLLIPGLWLGDSSAQETGASAQQPHRTRKPRPAPANPGGEPAGEGVGGHCGTERWTVKTLADVHGNDWVANAQVQDTYSIDPMTSDPSAPLFKSPTGPRDLPPDVRITGENSAGYQGPNSLETVVVRLHANLTQYALEKDRDYHVVVADRKTGTTMIVEIPEPSCDVTNTSSYAPQFGDARTQFQALLQRWGAPSVRPSPDFAGPNKPIPVVVRGVKFFDTAHRQNGVAQNGLELHPVLCIKAEADIGSGTECDPY